jgi:hypothetical protein
MPPRTKLIASDPGLSALKTQLSTKRAQLLEKLAGLNRTHPDRKQTERSARADRKEH